MDSENSIQPVAKSATTGGKCHQYHKAVVPKIDTPPMGRLSRALNASHPHLVGER